MNSDSTHNLPFNKYQSNTHSQNGEDGVINEILKRLNINDNNENWCVEFGAWDGKHLSNTFALVERGWNAIHIEGETDRFKDLLITAKEYPKIIPVNAFVGRFTSDSSSLDAILCKTIIPSDFALLSIDIDSYDCDVWESLKNYKPMVVVIEINSSVPPGIVWRHTTNTPLNSFTATCNVGTKKGYTLVCHTGNLIFVRTDLINQLNMDQRFIEYPELLFLYDSPWLPEKLFEIRRRHPFARFIPSPLRRAIVRLIPKPFHPLFMKIYQFFL